MAEEKIYTIPLAEVKKVPRYKRAGRAMKVVRDFLSKHSKEKEIKIDATVTEKIWACGARNPPVKIRAKLTKRDDGTSLATLAE